MMRKLPKFRNPEEAALFWEQNEILDFCDKDEFKIVDPRKSQRFQYQTPERRAPKRLISLRVGTDLIQKAQALSRHQRVGYQSILRNWLEKGAKKAA